MSKTSRVYWIDNLKGLLIILVVLGHAITNYSSVAKVPAWNVICDIIYAFHMPAFFVVSGYLQAVSNYGKEQDKKFILRKVVSLGIPLVCFSALYWGVKFVAVHVGRGGISNPQPVHDLF